MIRNFLTKVIFVVVFSLFFTGCSRQADQIAESDSIPESKIQNNVTITFFLPTLFNVGEKPDTRLVLDEIEKKINMKLDFQWHKGDNYLLKAREKIASGEKIDVFLSGEPQSYTFGFTDMFRAGEIKDITQLLPQYAPDLYKNYDADTLRSIQIDGKIAALPTLNPKSYANYAVVREDLMQKYNIPVIETYEDYEVYLKSIKDNEKGIVPGKIFTGPLELFAKAYDYAILDPHLYFVYKWNDPNMKVMAFEQTPEFKNTLSYLTRWNKSGYLFPGGSAGYQSEWEEAKKMIIEKRLSSFITIAERDAGESIETLIFRLNSMASMGPNPDVRMTAYRLYPKKKDQRLASAGNSWSTFSIAFSAKSNNTENALRFFNWIYEKQNNYDLFMYGIMGKHYELKGEQLKMPEGISYDKHPYIGWFPSDAFKSLYFERYADYYPDETKRIHVKYIEDNTANAPHEGFYLYDFLSTEEKTREYRDVPVFTSIILPILNGTYDNNKTDEIIENLSKRGVDALIDKIQKELDKWNR